MPHPHARFLQTADAAQRVAGVIPARHRGGRDIEDVAELSRHLAGLVSAPAIAL